MSEIEKIKRYITETNVSTEDAETCCMYVSEMKALYDDLHRDAFEAMRLIFNYGRAKGYRAAKTEAKRS